jgi:hypothetical protein
VGGGLKIAMGSAVVAACIAATVAHAHRHARGSEARLIRHTVMARWRADPCGPQPPHIRALISTADGVYGEALVRLTTVDIHTSPCDIGGWADGFLLHRHGRAWRIVASGPYSAPCWSDVNGHVPERVVRDFGLRGVRSDGSFGAC